MIFIVYITTNIITDQIYIGVHEQENPYEFDGYLGSGKILTRAVKKYGVENFVRETLFYYWNIEEAYQKESEIVTETFVVEDWNYNIIRGGKIPPSHKGTGGVDHHRYGLKESDETRKRKSITRTGMKCPWISESHIRNGVKPPNTTGKKWITNGVIDKYIMKMDVIPGGWTPGRSKAKIRNRS